MALLVDDEEAVRISTAAMLAELGYVVIEAASAEEALRLIANGAQVRLVITDHLMPGMTERIWRTRCTGMPTSKASRLICHV